MAEETRGLRLVHRGEQSATFLAFIWRKTSLSAFVLWKVLQKTRCERVSWYLRAYAWARAPP